MIARLALGLFVCAAIARAEEVLPPPQPDAGPGGREYAHARVTRERHGRGNEAYWIFAPADPVPERAPVVVFVHGWAALSPDAYRGWIEHLARRGSVVICPMYQESVLTLPDRFTDAAHAAVRDALERLERDGPVRLDLARAAVFGHSMGGVIATNLAGRAGAEGRDGLPRFRALMAVQPADVNSALGLGRSILEDPARVSAGTLALAVIGDRDRIAGDRMARRIHAGLTAVAPEDRDLVRVRSDGHGDVPLLADHFSPMASRWRGRPRRTGDLRRLLSLFTWTVPDARARRWALEAIAPDALDHRAYWKLLDGLLDAAFAGGRHRKYALGGKDEQLGMGEWSDGEPVRRLERE